MHAFIPSITCLCMSDAHIWSLDLMFRYILNAHFWPFNHYLFIWLNKRLHRYNDDQWNMKVLSRKISSLSAQNSIQLMRASGHSSIVSMHDWLCAFGPSITSLRMIHVDVCFWPINHIFRCMIDARFWPLDHYLFTWL